MPFPSNRSLNNHFRFFLGIAIVILGFAYLPYGWLAVSVGIQMGWERAVEHRNIGGVLLGVWWVVATILGNVQILFCLLSPFRENRLLQNPVLKTAALAGQLSWLPVAYSFYPWYPWFMGSIVLFLFTPRSRLFPDGNPYAARQDWKDSRILSKLARLPRPAGREEVGEGGEHEA